MMPNREKSNSCKGDVVRLQRLTLTLAVSASLLLLVFALTGCSSSGGSGLPSQSSASASSASPASFGLVTNKQYGFSFRCPYGWLTAAANAKPGKTSGPLMVASWADPQGKQVDGHYLDALQVSVSELNKPVTPVDVEKHAADFKIICSEMIVQQLGRRPHIAISDPFKPVMINGTVGFRITYSYLVYATPTGAMSYLLLKGHYAYWITGQASADTWSKAWRDLAPVMASFTVKPI